MKIKSNPSIYWLAAAGIITAGLIFFAYLPLSQQLISQADATIDKRQELSELQDQVQNYGKQQGVTELDKKQAELNRLLIPKANILEFLSDIEERAKTAGVTDTISINEFPANSPEILTHPITLTITGEYGGIYNFIRSLESLDYYLNFNQLAINSTSPTPKTTGSATITQPNDNSSVVESNMLELTLTGFAYWY